MRRALPLVTILVLTLLAAPALAQGITLQILEAPDVVVASDFEGEERTTPRYLFSTEVRVTNGDHPRSASLTVVTYLDKAVTGCPEQREDPQFATVPKFAKNLQFDARERVTVGGLTSPQAGADPGYWPMEVFRKYPNNRGGTTEYEEGEHGFCVVAAVPEDDPACDKPNTCWIGKAPFRAYVRHHNDAPQITRFDISPAEPRPGQQALFQADGHDNDTEPKPDSLTFTWDVGPTTKQGKVVRHAYNTPGAYEVTLTVSDGFETVNRTRTIQVKGAPMTDGDGSNGTPLGALAPLVAGLVAASLMRRRTG